MTLVLITLLIVLGVADCVTTWIGLKLGASEANPVAAPVLKALGPVAGMLALKLACTGILVAVLLARPGWWWLGAAFVAGYALVLANNVRVIARQRRINSERRR